MLHHRLENKGADKKPTQPLSTLTGHSHRVVKVAFHPSGHYLSSASYDGTWRLWDVETSKELLLQEGHSKEVYSVAFQPTDGSLMASGGLDAIGRVWDLRSGRSVMVLDGHIRDILSIDWSEATGYQLATGSNDDTIKVWDMRMLKCLYTIPGHKSSVSDVKFFKAEPGMVDFPKTIPDKKVQAEQPKPNGSALVNGGVKKEEEEDENGPMHVNGVNGEEEQKPDVSSAMEVDTPSQPAGWGARASAAQTAVPLSGMYLASAGYDGYVKIWSADDWQLVKSLNSEAGGRVMSVDLAQSECDGLQGRVDLVLIIRCTPRRWQIPCNWRMVEDVQAVQCSGYPALKERERDMVTGRRMQGFEQASVAHQ